MNEQQSALLSTAEDILAIEDAYQVLGVAKDADAKEIKSAYRKLSRKFHPDMVAQKGLSKDSDDAEIKAAAIKVEDAFKYATRAYDALDENPGKNIETGEAEPSNRAKYDKNGWAGVNGEVTTRDPARPNAKASEFREKHGWGKGGSDAAFGETVVRRGGAGRRGRGRRGADVFGREEEVVRSTPKHEEPVSTVEDDTTVPPEPITNEVFEVDSKLMQRFSELARKAGDVKTLQAIKQLKPKV